MKALVPQDPIIKLMLTIDRDFSMIDLLEIKGIPKTTIIHRIDKYVEDGVLERVGTIKGKAKKPLILYRVNKEKFEENIGGVVVV